MSDSNSDGNHHHGGFNNGDFQLMGILGALKTGDTTVDLILAMIAPLIIKFIFDRLGKIEDMISEVWDLWLELMRKPDEENERFISHSTTLNPWGHQTNTDEDTQNSILIKAIKLYISEVLQLKLQKAHLDLTELKDKSTGCGYNSDDDYDSDDEDHSEDGEKYGSRKTMAGMLSRYKIINRLPNSTWHELGEYGEPTALVRLHISRVSQQEDDGEKNDAKKNVEKSSITFHFRSSGEGAIDAFIDKAYRWYTDELRKMEDHSRYFYEMKVPDIKIGDADSSKDITYKRYKLSENKTFESLFFKEKENLLSLIDHFNEKTGKYSIPGYPHKRK
jgi:chaperone BCS1